MPTICHTEETSFYPILKPVFKLNGKAYLLILFCKGCTCYRLNTTVGDGMERIDKAVLPFVIVNLCRTFQLNSAAHTYASHLPTGRMP